MTNDRERIAAVAKVAMAAPFDAILCIEIENGAPDGESTNNRPETITINGYTTPPTVHASSPEKVKDKVDCLWRAKADTLLRVLETERALESAFVSGRLTITGDMSVMARLVIDQPAPDPRESKR